jgi:hypothetical protein
MIDFELRPPPGATDTLVPKKRRDGLPQPTSSPRKLRSAPVRNAARASLRRYTCPCGCGSTRWFSQARSVRGSSPA